MVTVVAAAFLAVTTARIQATAMAERSTPDEGSQNSDGKVRHDGRRRRRNLRLLAQAKSIPASRAVGAGTNVLVFSRFEIA